MPDMKSVGHCFLEISCLQAIFDVFAILPAAFLHIYRVFAPIPGRVLAHPAGRAFPNLPGRIFANLPRFIFLGIW